jgi:hypothetical protein
MNLGISNEGFRRLAQLDEGWAPGEKEEWDRAYDIAERIILEVAPIMYDHYSHLAIEDPPLYGGGKPFTDEQSFIEWFLANTYENVQVDIYENMGKGFGGSKEDLIDEIFVSLMSPSHGEIDPSDLPDFEDIIESNISDLF